MYAQVEKPKESKSRGGASSVIQKNNTSKQRFGIVDNRSTGSVESVAPVQRKMIYSKEAIQDYQKDLIPEKVGDVNTRSSDLINSGEPEQITELADALGQQLVSYEEGKAIDLVGEKVNYIVGHVVNLDDMAIWQTHEAEDVAEDFSNGGIETPSTIKLIACKAGQQFGAALSRGLTKHGKDVTVIASTGIVHATGKGITSYAPDTDSEEVKKHGFTGLIAKDAIEDVSKERKLLSKRIDKIRRNVRSLLEKEQEKEAEQEVNSAKLEISSFFSFAVQRLNESNKKQNPFSTPASEGWIKFKGGNKEDMTEEDEKGGVKKYAPLFEEEEQILEYYAKMEGEILEDDRLIEILSRN